MKSIVGSSQKAESSAAVAEACAQIKNPAGIIFLTDYDRLEQIGTLLSQNFPDTEIIGTAGISYHNTVIKEKGLLIVTAILGEASVSAGSISHLSTSPLSDLYRLEQSVNKVSPGRDNTVCIEFCTNDEEVLVSTMNIVLQKKNVSLVGGSVFGTPSGKASFVYCNGHMYEDACAYMVIKNLSGKVHVLRENIYGPAGGPAHIATKVNLKKKELIELDNRPASEVYSKETGVPVNKIVDNVLKAPLGRVVETEVFISSMNGIGNNGSITNYKRINENDTIYILKLLDYKKINEETKNKMRQLCSRPSLIFSVNCIYRYVLFQNEGYLSAFLKLMSDIAPFVGYIGGGEQYNNQHVNQTMTCAVFE